MIQFVVCYLLSGAGVLTAAYVGMRQNMKRLHNDPDSTFLGRSWAGAILIVIWPLFVYVLAAEYKK